jgi:hypothetical protein
MCPISVFQQGLTWVLALLTAASSVPVATAYAAEKASRKPTCGKNLLEAVENYSIRKPRNFKAIQKSQAAKGGSVHRFGLLLA